VERLRTYERLLEPEFMTAAEPAAKPSSGGRLPRPEPSA
jgi:hypothetical protein